MSGVVKGDITTLRRNALWEATDDFERTRTSSFLNMVTTTSKTQAPDTSNMKWTQHECVKCIFVSATRSTLIL